MRALQFCQPYDFLPAAKYEHWRTLVLTFAPDGLSDVSPVSTDKGFELSHEFRGREEAGEGRLMKSAH